MRPHSSLTSLAARGVVMALCAALVALLWAGIVLQLGLDRGRTIAAKRAENDNLMRLLAEDVVRTIRTADVTLGEMDAAYRRDGGKIDLVQYAIDRQLHLDPNTVLSINDENGDETASSLPNARRLNFSQNDNFQHHAASPSRELFISKPRPGSRTGIWTFYLSHRLDKADGSFGGVMAYGIDAAFLSRIYAEMDLGADTTLALVGHDGIIRAREANGKLEAGMDVGAGEVFRQFMSTEHAGSVIASSVVDRVTRLYSSRGVGDYPLFVTLGTSLDDALSAYHERRNLYLLAGGGISVVILSLGLLAAAIIARSERTSRDAIDQVEAAARRARQSEAHLMRAQEVGSIGSFEWSFADDSIIWSSETYRIWGTDPERFLPSPDRILERVHPEHRPRLTACYRRARDGVVDAKLECRVLHSDGRGRMVRWEMEPVRDAGGAVIGIIGTNQDITEQRLTEMRLNLLQSVSLAIAEAEDFQDALTVVLRIVCTLTEWAYGEAWVPEPDGTRLALTATWHADLPGLAALAESRRAQPLYNGPGRLGTAWATGRPVWMPDLATEPSRHATRPSRARTAGLAASYTVPIGSGGQELAVLRFATLARRERDQAVTESIAAVAAQLGTALGRKRAEQALRDSEQQLRQAQKMEAIGTLTGGLAHDFNNLLGVIIGNLDLLAEEVADRPEAAELSGDALQAALRGAALTRSLLAFARRQPLRPEPVDLNELVGSLVKLLRRVLGERIEVQLSLGEGEALTIVDRAQLEAVITNLATNARDSMPEGGRLAIATRSITLGADRMRPDPEIPAGDYVVVEVSDTGSGIASEAIDHIFEPFFSTKHGGSGLGLSMVYGFIKQSGGHIAVASAPGQGTRFRLYMTRGASAVAASPASTATVSAPRRGETVLVVEDNDMMRGVVVRQISSFGYQVIACENAAAALEFIASEAAIDLLFTDVVMPGRMDGFELAREAASRRPRLKILLTSGFPETHHAQGLSHHRLLGKPYRMEELARMLRETLDSPLAAMPPAEA